MRLLLLILLTTSTLRADFIPPTRGLVLFRRDALELDADRQLLLAQNLLILARRANALENPAQRRATAQCLALALSLNPNAKATRKLALSFQKNPTQNPLFPTDHEFPLRHLVKVILFLLADPSNAEHREIAQLIIDPLTVIVPDHDIILARPKADESPRWENMIAPLNAF